MDGAVSLFKSLRRWSDLERLKEEATPEGIYLECKTQVGVRLNGAAETSLPRPSQQCRTHPAV